MPLQGAQQLIFVALFISYLTAFRSNGSSFVAWLVYLCKCFALALFIRATGGAMSPLQVLAYPWLFGSALVLLLDGLRPTVASWLVLIAALTLVLGGRCSSGFLLFIVINALSLVSMFAALLTPICTAKNARVATPEGEVRSPL